MSLNTRQQLFALEYLKDFNATQAAIRAGYSAKTAASQGERLLRHVEIAARVREAKAERVDRVKVEADDVLRELLLILGSSVDDYAVKDGRIATRDGIDAKQLRAVSSVKHKVRKATDRDGNPEETVETEYRLWDKPRIIELAGKHLGLFPDKVDLSVDADVTVGANAETFEAAAAVVESLVGGGGPVGRRRR